MQRHRRRIGQVDLMPRQQFKTLMLTRRVASVGFEQEGDRGQTISVLVCDLCAVLEEEGQAFAVVRFTGPQLPFTPRASSCSRRGWRVTNERTVLMSSRQMASVIRHARTSRGQLATP
jgi:hypothetical protein